MLQRVHRRRTRLGELLSAPKRGHAARQKIIISRLYRQAVRDRVMAAASKSNVASNTSPDRDEAACRRSLAPLAKRDRSPASPVSSGVRVPACPAPYNRSGFSPVKVPVKSHGNPASERWTLGRRPERCQSVTIERAFCVKTAPLVVVQSSVTPSDLHICHRHRPITEMEADVHQRYQSERGP
jgi:hypothetical protein